MSEEPRKASEVLLDLENKVNTLLSLVSAQDLNIKILSNKLNEIMTTVSKQTVPQQKPSAEAVHTLQYASSPLQAFKPIDPERQIPVAAAARLPQTNAPEGVRRTARPENFEIQQQSQSVPQPTQQVMQPQFPNQTMPKPPPGREGQQVTQAAEILAQQLPQPPQQQSQPFQRPQPPQAPSNLRQMAQAANTSIMPEETFPAYESNKPSAPTTQPTHEIKHQFSQGNVPVIQRVVNKDGKSIFLADVEVLQAETLQSIFKTRTNGTGKWMASLGVGSYKVFIRKLESATKAKMEAIQEIHIDGSQSKVELPVVIIK